MTTRRITALLVVTTCYLHLVVGQGCFFGCPPPPPATACKPAADGVCRCDATVKGDCLCTGGSCECLNTGTCLCNNATSCHCANVGDCYCGAASTCSMEPTVVSGFCKSGSIGGSSAACGGWSIQGDMWCVPEPYNATSAGFTKDEFGHSSSSIASKCNTVTLPLLLTLGILMLLAVFPMVYFLHRSRSRKADAKDAEIQATNEKIRAAITKPGGKGAGMEPLIFNNGQTYGRFMTFAAPQDGRLHCEQLAPMGIFFLFIILVAGIAVTFAIGGPRSSPIGFLLIPLLIWLIALTCTCCQSNRAGRGRIVLTLDPKRGELIVEQVVPGDPATHWLRYSESLENFHHASVAYVMRTGNKGHRYVQAFAYIERVDTSGFYTTNLNNGLMTAGSAATYEVSTITRINEFLSLYHGRPIDYEPKAPPSSIRERVGLFDQGVRWMGDHEPMNDALNVNRWLEGVHVFELPKLRFELRPAYAQQIAVDHAAGIMTPTSEGALAHREPPPRPASTSVAPPTYSETVDPVKASDAPPGYAPPAATGGDAAPLAPNSFCGQCGGKHNPELRFCSFCGFDTSTNKV